MIQKDLLKKVKNSVQEIETDAEILLYGSRARGDSVDQSDWDFLILLDGKVNDKRTDRIRHRLYEIEWETGEVISSIIRCIIRNQSAFTRLRSLKELLIEESLK